MRRTTGWRMSAAVLVFACASSAGCRHKEEAEATPVVTVNPVRVDTPNGPVVRIPIEAGYGVSEVSAEGVPRA